MEVPCVSFLLLVYLGWNAHYFFQTINSAKLVEAVRPRFLGFIFSWKLQFSLINIVMRERERVNTAGLLYYSTFFIIIFPSFIDFLFVKRPGYRLLLPLLFSFFNKHFLLLIEIQWLMTLSLLPPDLVTVEVLINLGWYRERARRASSRGTSARPRKRWRGGKIVGEIRN